MKINNNKVFPIRNQKLPIWSMYLKAGLGFLQKSVTLKWLWAQKDRCAEFPSQGTGLYHLLQGQRDSSQTIYFPPKDE